MRWAAGALVALLATACGGGLGGGAREVELAALLADPASFADQQVRVRATFFEDPQVRVLTEALAESYPPQPAGAMIWVEGRAPEGGCLESDLGIVWGEVEAKGVFRHSSSGGLGVPPIYELALVDAELSCPSG